MRAGAVMAAGLLLVALLHSGCLVDSRCQWDYDCGDGQRCNRESGACFVECTGDSDCWAQGKECIAGRCEFRFDERVAAPSFCLGVINPASSWQGEELCLDDLEGRVVLIYFALLA